MVPDNDKTFDTNYFSFGDADANKGPRAQGLVIRLLLGFAASPRRESFLAASPRRALFPRHDAAAITFCGLAFPLESPEFSRFF